MTPTEAERLRSLEDAYGHTVDMFKEIRDHLAKQNGHLAELQEFRIRHDEREKTESVNRLNLRWWFGAVIAVNGIIIVAVQLALRI